MTDKKDLTVYRVRVSRFHELDEGTVSAWRRLEERALESNAYLSPRFVIPAVRHLCGPKETGSVLFVFVESGSGVKRITGVGVFQQLAGTLSCPFPHLKAFLSPHSYISGLLIDRDEAGEVARAFFGFFCGRNRPWQGVDFPQCASEGPQARLILDVAKEFGAEWHESCAAQRAIFVPKEGGEEYLKGRFSPHRAKMIRQARHRLEELGQVRWKAFFGSEIGRDNVDRFLELEHMGWKGEQGTSLLANPAHEAFFRDMAEAFRIEGHFFITELSLGGLVIASTANMVSGGTGFAFKIGWLPEYSKLSPGVLNEVEFIRRAPELCGGLSYIDSGAEGGSFIDRLWSGRRGLASGVFATSASGRRIIKGVEIARQVKHICGNMLRRADRNGNRD